MTLWKNGFIHTLRTKQEIIHEMITKDGVIIATGRDVTLYQPAGIIDLKGMHLYPGFVDAHLHLVGYGLSLTIPNISKHKTKAAIISYLKQAYRSQPLFVEGYGDINITKDDLDAISNRHFIILRHADYHSYTVNSVVLDTLKIVSQNGILKEKDGESVATLFLARDQKTLYKATKNAISSLHHFGITTILTDDLAYFNSYEETLNIIDHLTHKMKMRTHLLVHKKVLADYLSTPPDETPFLKVNGIKTFYDGTLSSRSALLSSPYRDTNTQGQRMHTPGELENLLIKVRQHQLPLAVHTIGDLALQELTTLLLKYPTTPNVPDRIIHASLADRPTIEKLSTLNVVLDVQPQFIKSDLPQTLSLIDEYTLIYPFNSYKKAKIKLSLTSDAPVETPNPLLGIYAAVTRRGHDNQRYHLKERLTRFQALKGYTIDAARHLGYKNKGHIKQGYLADFVVYEKDILAVPLEKLTKQKVIMTIVDGVIVYEDKEKSPR